MTDTLIAYRTIDARAPGRPPHPCPENADDFVRRTEASLHGLPPRQQYERLSREFLNEFERFKEIPFLLNPFHDYDAAVQRIKNDLHQQQQAGCQAFAK